MNRKELHDFIEEKQPNICQISCYKDGKEVYSDEWNNYNLTLIMNKSRIPEEKRIFCDSTLDYHLTSYGYYYFKFIFLDILSRYLGKTIIKHKYKLDKIKLQKRKFGKLIKHTNLNVISICINDTLGTIFGLKVKENLLRFTGKMKE